MTGSLSHASRAPRVPWGAPFDAIEIVTDAYDFRGSIEAVIEIRHHRRLELDRRRVACHVRRVGFGNQPIIPQYTHASRPSPRRK